MPFITRIHLNRFFHVIKWGQRSARFHPDTLDFEGQHHIVCNCSVKNAAFMFHWKYRNLLLGNIIQACKLRISITSFCDPNYSYS